MPEFPPETTADVYLAVTAVLEDEETAQANLDLLVRNGYLTGDKDGYFLTPAGFLAYCLLESMVAMAADRDDLTPEQRQQFADRLTHPLAGTRSIDLKGLLGDG